MTFRAVAKTAGVNNALIAHHFGSREGLLAAALEWTTQRVIVSSALEQAAERPQVFQAALDAVAMTEHKLLLFQYELILEASRNERFREPVALLYQAYFRALAPYGAGSSALTRARFAAFDGLVLQMLSGAISQQEFDESLHAVLNLPWASAP